MEKEPPDMTIEMPHVKIDTPEPILGKSSFQKTHRRWSSPLKPAHEKIGVVDSQWIIHQVIPLLGNQGVSENGKPPWQGVKERCRSEWAQFQTHVAEADKAYFAQYGTG